MRLLKTHKTHCLVVEQPDVLLNERDTELLCGLENCAVILATCRCSNVLGTAPVRPEDVVDEGEEGVRRQGDTLELRQPLLALFCGEVLRNVTLLEVCGKVIVLRATIRDETRAEQVDSIRLGWALGALLELEIEGTLVEAHPPVVSLVTGEACAVDASWVRLANIHQ